MGVFDCKSRHICIISFSVGYSFKMGNAVCMSWHETFYLGSVNERNSDAELSFLSPRKRFRLCVNFLCHVQNPDHFEHLRLDRFKRTSFQLVSTATCVASKLQSLTVADHSIRTLMKCKISCVSTFS